ncbi:MAG: Ig-like domain-containing protein [Actinomycetes bacterium]
MVAAGAPRLENIYGPTALNPAHFGPVLSTLVWALSEAAYQIQGLAPLAKPNQLPSTPGQAQVVGTLNTVAPFGARVKFAVTNAPANGIVTIDSQGFYTYTPNAALAAAGGTDEFAVTATDLGMHLENLFGLPGHATTMVVPVTVAPQITQPQVAANLADFTVYNTSWATQTVAKVSGGQGVVVVPGVGTQLQTAQTTHISVDNAGTLLAVNFNSAASSPPGTLVWGANTLSFLAILGEPLSSVGCNPTVGSCSTPANPSGGGPIYFADAPGTVYTVPAGNAQQQSDVLQNLVAADLSNARFYPRSQPTIGYTNPLKAQGFTPYTNITLDNSTNTYTITQTTTKTDSSQYNVSVKFSAQYKLGLLTATAESSATATWGTTTANALTYTQSTTQTVRPEYTLFLYTETPVNRFYGDWSVVYGNTTYILNNVWYDSPNPVTGQYSQYLAAYTCKAGSVECAQLAAGQIPTSYPNAWPAGPTYPVAESSANATVSSNKLAQRRPLAATV